MLKIAVIVMGILLVGGFAFVMAAIVYQASQLGEKPPGAPEPSPAAVAEGAPAMQRAPAIGASAILGTLAIPPDAKVLSMSLDGDRLALHLQSRAGSEIAVIDVATGKVLSRIKLNTNTP